MAVEFECKYSASREARAAIREAYPGPWLELHMESTYYDTPDGDISARKWTLRRRMENGVSICTLKTPAGNARNEWEVPCDDIERSVMALCDLGAPRELKTLVWKGLVPVCGARFVRLARSLKLSGGSEAELALDEGILFAGDRQVPLGEMELELKAGDPGAVKRTAEELAQRFGLQKQRKSKFKRAYDLRRESNGTT